MRQTNIPKLSYSWPLYSRQCQGRLGELRWGRQSAFTSQGAPMSICVCFCKEGRVTEFTGKVLWFIIWGEHSHYQTLYFLLAAAKMASEMPCGCVASMRCSLVPMRHLQIFVYEHTLVFIRVLSGICCCFLIYFRVRMNDQLKLIWESIDRVKEH